MLFSPGYPGFLRGRRASGPGEFVVTTSGGQLTRYRPGSSESEVLADGFDQLYGVAVSPAVSPCRIGTGRLLSWNSGGIEVLATDLREPVGVAIDADGACLVAEAGAGTVVKVDGSKIDTVVADCNARRASWCATVCSTSSTPGQNADRVRPEHPRSADHRVRVTSRPSPGCGPKPLIGMPPFSGRRPIRRNPARPTGPSTSRPTVTAASWHCAERRTSADAPSHLE